MNKFAYRRSSSRPHALLDHYYVYSSISNNFKAMEEECDEFTIFCKYLTSLKCKENADERETIRSFLLFLQRSDNNDLRMHSPRNINLMKSMLSVLAGGKLRVDNQILLSTAYCLLLESTLEREAYDKILCQCITFVTILRLPSPSGSDFSIFVEDADYFRIALSWSILKSFDVDSLKTFYAINSDEPEYDNASPFEFVFDSIEQHCNSYSNITLISFKIIPIWLNRMEEIFVRKLIDESTFIFYLKRVLSIVSSNWENIIAGVREKNVEILRTAFIILSKIVPNESSSSNWLNLSCFLGMVSREVPWRMKCKYFMLMSLLPQFGVKEGLTDFPNICNGLIYSLFCPHLVSAGADCYRRLLKEMSEDQWQTNFYTPLKMVMISKDRIAQGNLMSYWMPDTLKTFPLVVNQMLHDILSEVDSSSALSVIALYRIGRKCGLLKWEQVDHELLMECLIHIREDIRGEAFTAVCVSTKTTSLPTDVEIEMVHLFLEENVNNDSSKLRQVMITSFKSFTTRIRVAQEYLHLENEQKAVTDSEKVIGFFRWLLKFLVGNFVPGANYQRRITSLYLLRVAMESLCHGFPGKLNCWDLKSTVCMNNNCWFRHKICRFQGCDIFAVLLDCLMDSAADVRVVASDILKTHFKEPSGDLFLRLWEKALSMCSSSLFYEIESGAVLAETLIHWKSCTISSTEAKEEMPFVEVLLSLAEGQKVQLEVNVLKGAASAPVHGILSVLNGIICCPDILAFLDLDGKHVKRLLKLIDGLTTFALGVLSSKQDSGDMAPSFAEMGVALECAVSENFDYMDDFKMEELPAASELVLNCLWLNLKVCCMVASSLTIHLSQNVSGPSMKEDEVEFCGNLLIRVLMKCRHKGAIESAGKCLSSFAVFCVSHENPKLRALPRKLLSQCLEKTFERREGRSSITRRSAGLSILVHKLIVADAKIAVPLCIPKLLSWTEMESLQECSHAETEDLPQTQALFFLKSVVQDSALYQYISPYMSEITLVSLKNFSSGVWAIRNAALQLFGAIVPKLVGQKKGEEEDIVGSNVTIEELNAHYPMLLNYMLKELKESVSKCSKDSALTSPNLLPILILCSKLTLGVPQMHSQLLKRLLLEFQAQFHHLLSSASMAIRKSSAKAIATLTPLNEILTKIKSLINGMSRDSLTSENEMHGKLLCIKTLRDRLQVDSYLLEEYSNSSMDIERLIVNINISGELVDKCYFSRALLCQMQGFTDCDVGTLGAVRLESSRCYHLGLMQWAAASIECLIMTCFESCLITTLKSCFKCGEYLAEAALQSLTERLKKEHFTGGFEQELMNFLYKVSIADASINVAMHCLNSMMQLCCKSPVTHNLNQIEVLFHRFVANSNYGVGCSTAALSVVSHLIVRNEYDRNTKLLMVKVIDAINEISLPGNLEEIRLCAVGMLKSFLPWIDPNQKLLHKGRPADCISGEIISAVIDSTVLLLQDENVMVRKETAQFVSKLIVVDEKKNFKIDCINSHRCINILLTQITSFLPLGIAVKFLWNKLTNTLTPNELQECSQSQTIKNPFDHGSGNIYSEQIFIAKLSGESLKLIIKSCRSELNDIVIALPVDIPHLLEMGTFLSSLVEKLGDNFNAHTEIYLAFVSVKYQLEITILLGLGSVNNSQSMLSQLERSSSKFCVSTIHC